jgi:hypothetical protein
VDSVSKRAPRRIVRLYVEGAEVTPEQFWQAVRDLGGRATITAHDPQPLREEPGYRLTELGRAALERPSEGPR